MRKALRLLLRLFLLALFIATIWIIATLTRTISNEGDWQTQFKVLPSIELNQDTITITNLRDFRYNTDESISEVRYLNETYLLSEFKNVWYGISHFGENGLAHVLLSFEFSNDKFLAVSIEARLQNKNVDGYHPIAGLFGAYTQTIVLATEQDVIGLRTHVRGEPFYLYKLELPEIYTKPLLLNYLRKAHALTQKPALYDSILDNCMTGLLAESQQFKSMFSWFDKRILLPGNSDSLAYDLGYIDQSKPFQQVKEHALIDSSVTQIEDPDFSTKIRYK